MGICYGWLVSVRFGMGWGFCGFDGWHLVVVFGCRWFTEGGGFGGVLIVLLLRFL